MLKYTLAVTSPEYWSTIHNALIIDSNEDGIPDRKIECIDSKNHSPTRGTYELTEEEAEEISKHPQVEWIELSVIDYPHVYPHPQPDTKRFRDNVKVYRDLGSNAPPTNATSTEENRTNWAVKRVGVSTNGDGWPSAIGNPSVINSDISFSLTGKNVDLVIQDSGVLQYHPEFIDGDGKSRVRDIILDGPYYIDPNYFDSNALTYTKPDGRTGITTTSAHSWWENSSNRTAAFSSLGTILVPNAYTEANALGIGGTSHTMTSSHGTGCAGLAAGKNYGLAFESNIWTISIFSPADITTDASYDAMKIFHENKPINIQTGRQNPTVVNGSWGYYGGFNSNTQVYYSFKGTTGDFTGYASNSTGVQALAYGLDSGLLYNRQFSSSSRSNSVDTAGDEMVNKGVIFVTSAGNNNQRLGIGSDDPHINDYLTSLNGGDSRSGFPSESQSGTLPSGHVKWIHPQRNGHDPVKDTYSSIIVGAMDEFITTDYKERKASYSNNGPAIDVWAPADETLSAGMRAANGDQLPGGDINYSRYNSNFVDMFFNGTSAAAPVVTGAVALFLQSKPNATSAEVKDFIKNYGSRVLPSSEWEDTYPDETSYPNDYWRGDFNNRGAASRILFDPTANDAKPTFSNITGGENIVKDGLMLNLDAANYTAGSSWTNTAEGGAGQQLFANTGTTSFSVPYGVTKVSGVVVGAGGGGARASFPTYPGAGGGGGGLAYGSFDVTPGETLTIVVGSGGQGGAFASGNGKNGGSTQIKRGSTVLLQGGGGAGAIDSSAYQASTGGSGGSSTGNVRIGGGTGGDGGTIVTYYGSPNASGGGGAGGYSGNGGNGGIGGGVGGGGAGNDGSGGGGGGGGSDGYGSGSNGGGVGLLGEGNNGVGGSAGGGYGGNGSGDTVGYGRGGGGAKGHSLPYGAWQSTDGNAGTQGAARIIWGTDREFPIQAKSGDVTIFSVAGAASLYNSLQNDMYFANGSYFNFNGSNHYVDVYGAGGNFNYGTDEFTMECWIRLDSLPTSGNEYGIMGQGANPLAGAELRITNDAGTIRFNFLLGGAASLTPVATIPIGEWIHIACGRGPVSGYPSGFFIYQNGVEIDTFDNTNSIDNSTNPFYIGRSFFSSRYFDGDIAQVRVYKNKSLSKSEIDFNINAMKGRYEMKPLLFSGVSYSLT